MKNKYKIGEKAALSLLMLFFTSIYLFAQANYGTTGVREFRAGASTSNITPKLGQGIVGGFGTPPTATHVHDQLHARTLALDDGSTQLVFVVVDNVAIKREVFDEAKRRIQEKTGLPASNILMSATHTHSCVG